MNKTLYIMVGISGAGKTEFVKSKLIKGPGWYHVSRDTIRFALLGETDKYFDHEEEVYNKFTQTIAKELQNDNNYYVVADATHLNKGSRMKLLNSLKNSGIDLTTIDIIPIMMRTDIIESIRRNEQREGLAKVPTNIIKSMSKSLTDPSTDDYKYTAIMYVDNGPHYTEKPKFMYKKNDIRMKEISIKDVIKK